MPVFKSFLQHFYLSNLLFHFLIEDKMLWKDIIAFFQAFNTILVE